MKGHTNKANAKTKQNKRRSTQTQRKCNTKRCNVKQHKAIAIQQENNTKTQVYGAYSPQGIKLVKQIGKKIQDATGEKLSTINSELLVHLSYLYIFLSFIMQQ